MALQEQYLTDQEGNRVGVVLGWEQYEHMMKDLEELEDIRAFDAAMEARDESIPFQQAIAEIEQRR